MNRNVLRVLAVLGLMLAMWPALAAWAQRGAKKPVKRAEQPKFTPAEVDIFFSDVFAKVQGERPANFDRAAPAAVVGPPGGNSTSSGDTGGRYAWSEVISASALEDEVKAIKLSLDQDITTPGKFAGQGYEACRTHFSVLAMLFAIVGEYEGEVRWKEDAPAARDLFARTAANCKVGTSQVYNEAKLRKLDVQDLVGGASLAKKEGDPETKWENVCDRAPLMRRLDASRKTVLQPFTSSKSEFSANIAKVRHEAEITAAIADVLTKDGMEDGGDDDYSAFAKRMKKAARDIVEAVKLDNHEQAQSAVGEINKACDECHENYRA